MKNIILLMMMSVVFCMSSCAQDLSAQQVPSTVLNAFSSAYPKATDIEWERHNQYYKVDFDLLLEDHELLIDSSGSIIRHKQDIGNGDLPAPVKEAIQKRYQGYHVDEADKIEQQGKVYYKVELEKGENELKVIFNPDGTLSDIIF